MRVAAKAFIDAGRMFTSGTDGIGPLDRDLQEQAIFYGIGNFFAQNEFLGNVPYDSYEAWDMM